MIIEACNVDIAFDGRTVLSEGCLALESGTVTGVIGPNGAGKSSVLRALAGQVAPGSGEIRVAGSRLSELNARERATRVSFVAQETATAIDFTVREMVSLGRYARRGLFSREAAEDREAVSAALEAVGIAGLADRECGTLSGGERQLAHIARALAQEAPVLILDEPTSALDVHHRLRVFEIIRQQAARGTAVAIAVHDLTEAARVCDRIAVVHAGRLRPAARPAEVLTERLLAEVYRIVARVHIDDAGTLTIDALRPCRSGDTVPLPGRTP